MNESIELKEVSAGAQAAPAGSETGSTTGSSDTDSWTILDEQDIDEDLAKEQESKEVQPETSQAQNEEEDSIKNFNESDSDIETLDRGFIGGIFSRPPLVTFVHGKQVTKSCYFPQIQFAVNFR